MTDEQSTGATSASTRGRSAYGTAPVIAAGVLSIALIGLLVTGGVSAAGALTNPPSHPAQALPTPSTGVETPVADPSTPPDRDSDQPEVEQPEDTIYYIQRGDTLTALSARFGVSIDALASWNYVRDVNLINEGAVLRVPFIYVPPPAADQ